MKIAMLSPLSWRTPPRHYGPWENVVSLLTEQLVAMGVDVTLFATGDSLTRGKLAWVCERPYSEDPSIDPKQPVRFSPAQLQRFYQYAAPHDYPWVLFTGDFASLYKV
jgi:hypothetical protein